MIVSQDIAPTDVANVPLWSRTWDLRSVGTDGVITIGAFTHRPTCMALPLPFLLCHRGTRHGNSHGSDRHRSRGRVDNVDVEDLLVVSLLREVVRTTSLPIMLWAVIGTNGLTTIGT